MHRTFIDFLICEHKIVLVFIFKIETVFAECTNKLGLTVCAYNISIPETEHSREYSEAEK